jgi:glycosyltransferase involved in cell wall biosynthesis
MNKENMVMATPFRTDYYRGFAQALEKSGHLRQTILWKREGYPDIPPEKATLWPLLGKITYASIKLFPRDLAQSIRFRLHPFYDRWAADQLQPGDNVYSSYGYANKCFEKARSNGGKTFVDGGNSHPAYFWDILCEEHARWGYKEKPIPEFHRKRCSEMMKHTDFVFAPSAFVARSFLEQGFREDQILRMFYPVDLRHFKPDDAERPKNKPFTIVNTGALSLRKGTPYLLEAFRLIHKAIPDVRFMLSKGITASAAGILEKYSDLPIEWSKHLGHAELAQRFRQADLFMLPSLEDGFARVVTEAMACGLPAIISENVGAADYIQSGVNGEIVPIRDPEAMAEAAICWWKKIKDGYKPPVAELRESLSSEAYQKRMIELYEQALR